MPVTPTTTGIDPYSVTFEPSTPESISAKATGKVERPAALEVEVSKDSYSYLMDFGKVTSRAPRLNEPSTTPSQNDYNKALAETGNLGGENAYVEMENMMILFEKLSRQQTISSEKATMADAQAQESMMEGSADELRSSATAALIGGFVAAGLSIAGGLSSAVGAGSDIAELSSAEEEFNTSASETSLNAAQQNQIEQTGETSTDDVDEVEMENLPKEVPDDDESQKSPLEQQRAFDRAKMTFQNRMTKMNLEATKLQGWVTVAQGLGSVSSGIGQDVSGQLQAQAKEDEAKATYEGGLQQNMQQFMSSAQQNVDAAQSALESVMQGYASTSEKLV
jgi:hypothetical protein